jgi:hydroxyethylthiazole kinase
VLDPVAAGALGWRTSLAQQLLGEARPTIVRGNASEILALAGGTGGRGVESVDSPEAAAQVARDLAEEQQSVIAVSGPTDHITDGERMVLLSNGHPWLTRVTGVGCALGALMAAFAAVVPDAVVAAAAATATLTVASESAAQQARGPGSFAVALLDELSLLQPADLAERVRIT